MRLPWVGRKAFVVDQGEILRMFFKVFVARNGNLMGVPEKFSRDIVEEIIGDACDIRRTAAACITIDHGVPCAG